MKLTFGTGLFCFLLLFGSMAQALSKQHCKNGKHMNVLHNLTVMEKVLGLSSEQVDKIQGLRTEQKRMRNAQKTEMKALKKTESLAELNPDSPSYDNDVMRIADRKANKAKNRFLVRAEYRAKLHRILTSEQREIWRSMKQSRRDR